MTLWPGNTISQYINIETQSNLLHGLTQRAGSQSVCCHVLVDPGCWEPLYKEQVGQTQNNKSSVC